MKAFTATAILVYCAASGQAAPVAAPGNPNFVNSLNARDAAADPLFKTGLKFGARLGNEILDINDDGEGGIFRREADPLFKTGLKFGARLGNEILDINDDGEGGIFKRKAQPGFLSGLKWGARLGSELFDFGDDD